jgi:hypothetical protein
MKNNNPDSLLFQNYLVVFIDLLGQREALRKITGIPTSEPDKERFIELAKESIGKVLQIRDSFKLYYASAHERIPDEKLVPPEYRDEFKTAMKKAPASYYGLSDAMIIAVPLMSTADENCAAINGIHDAFVATCGIGLLALSVHVPLRAGLDIGVATQIHNNEIYGPALESAYYLESKVAEYPRFVVGKELINYLLWVANQKCHSRIGEVAKGAANFCKQMVIQDSDGNYMLDFLGGRFKESSEDVIEPSLVMSALKFVGEEYKKYFDANNHKMASRYYRLLRYFNSRRSLWGLSNSEI